MDISAAFLKGMTFKEIAKETGDTLQSVQFDFPPGDVWILRKLPGMEIMTGHWTSWTSRKQCGD
eukprot:3222177-Prorocentrum_lima.AAC.1